MGKKQSKMDPHQLIHLLNRTKFEEKELEKWYQKFIKEYPDGFISKPQFENMYQSFFPKGDAREFADHIFRTFDGNSDGKIDFREFMVSLSVTTRGSADQKLEWAFKVYDVDGNGFITRKEMQLIVHSVEKVLNQNSRAYDMSDKRTERIFKNFDKNQDGVLSLNEFSEAAKLDPTLSLMLNEAKAGPGAAAAGKMY
ncbi:neuron-specific calcium-binding protein hippocalcin-like [Dendronephthya gigantea]|uniref:neuron-specific calcium-binding protein hippocalcin-like n=1 Tax=Dendronephthya gigantea TaxID=151771 RepID=UPI00106D9CA3|nr:neuron-specific calcium-binding protein hippocalcin-like [Dendronephthya gigantea]